MKKRVLAALLVTMMTVGTVAGCGSNAKSDDSDKKASSESKSDDKKDSGKKVTVVTSGTGEPYSLISDDGKWTGIDAEMWDEISYIICQKLFIKETEFCICIVMCKCVYICCCIRICINSSKFLIVHTYSTALQ